MQSNLATHRQAKRLKLSGEMMPSMPGELADKVACDKCGAYVEYVKCKLQSKKAFKWTCPACGTSTTQLRRHFGTWPTDTFSMLSSDAQSAFYNSIKELNTKQMVSKAETLTGTQTFSETYRKGGRFLPLSVWCSVQ
jgi:predicted RNA-binding Zn-ribbon protein involved in translation (DUF1610 family)